MAFPTIPTVASGDLLSSTTSPASTTHTFPNLSSLRGGAGPQSGDLLIAICVQYGAATAGNQYSSWGASFTELLDDSLSSGTGVGAVGIARKVATGSESGTFTVTSATSSKSVQFLMRIPAGTWHGTTIPEVLSAVRATGLAADPGSFDPANWGAEDTLWISVAGQTETSTTGSPPTLDSPPANYSDQLIVARAADAVGDITAGVAFRQVNASAENVGTWTATNANRGNGIATVIAIRPYIPTPKSTSVAEISLASHGTPSEQTNHAIKIRARTTSGSTGVIKAALYEGTTNRSGDLTSLALTNSLADYTLAISDASAANITDYSNLSIKFWGYDPNGGSLVFEVADLYLELPEAAGPATLYGVVASPFTFTKAVSATKQTFGQTVSSLTFGKAVSGIRSAFGQILAPFTFTKVVSGTKKTFGQIVAPFTFTKSVSGKLGAFGQIALPIIFTKSIVASKQTFGQIVSPFVFVKNVIGNKTVFGQIISPFVFVKNIIGQRTTFGQIAFPVIFAKAVTGVGTIINQISTSFTFVKDVSGSRKTFSQIISPFTFTKVVSGTKKTFGQIVAPIVFVKETNGKLGTFSQITRPFTFVKDVAGSKQTFAQVIRSFTFVKDVSGRKTTFSRIDLPLIFTDQTSGHKETFGNVGLPINFTFDVIAEVQGIRFGQTSMSLVFDKDVDGTKETFGQLNSPYSLVRSIQAVRTTFSGFAFPFTFFKDIRGQRQTFGSSTLPINVTIVVGGTTSSTIYGEITLSFIFGEQTIGQRGTFGQIVRPYNFNAELSGLLETFGSVDFPVDFIVNVNTGRVEAFSNLAVELLLALETAGIIKSEYVILNMAKAIYLGSTPVDSVYTDSQKVWP
jgi:hypothetical protein